MSKPFFMEPKFIMYLHRCVFVLQHCHRWLKFGWKSLSKWHVSQRCKFVHKEWQIMMGLQLVLVTLQGGWELELSKTQVESVTLYTKKYSVSAKLSHFTHETESLWPLHFEHSRRWKRRSRSKFASHYASGTDGVCECKLDVKSTWVPTSHQMDQVLWSL